MTAVVKTPGRGYLDRVPMRHRGLRIFILAFAVVWFAGVVPAHPRGVVRTEGKAIIAVNECTLPPCHRAAQPKKNPSSQSPSGNGGCAVCMFAAALAPPAPIIAAPAPPALVEIAVQLAPDSLPGRVTLLTCYETGPPIL